MACDPKAEAAMALHRFGCGPRIGAIAAIGSDPRGALLAELDRPGIGRIADPDLLSGGEAARAAFHFRQQKRAQRLAQRAEREMEQQAAAAPAQPGATAAPSDAAGADNAENMAGTPETSMAAKPKRDPGPGIPQQLYLEEAKARIGAALGAELGLVERLVWFWSNHFGRSADMRLAVESHPAMLVYLDNARSIGPDSLAGRNRGKGLNENLAREILELHTLGVRSGYSQDDVTSFAKVITGWTLAPPKQDPERGGEFVFNPRMHQPGPQHVMGKRYADAGVEQGRAVLLDLARHPATARHLAQKLARAFVADVPPAVLVESLAKRFEDTDGDLKEVAKTLVSSPEVWAAPREKLKTPGEWIVAALRATGASPPDIRPVLQAHNLLGAPLWRPPAPKGFPDDSAAWMDGIAERLDIANQLARRMAPLVDPEGAVDLALGPLATAETRQAVARAESRPQALALLLMAPEFQRR